MARDHSAHDIGGDEFPDPDSRKSRVVGDHSEVFPALPDQFIHQAFGRSNTHESANHDGCTIRYLGNRILNRRRSHRFPAGSMPLVG